ncbi:YesL family protein [Oceanobacillus manasiensis]|uniref:YesL family protein n=1 Tax=Oceanobacillus manasiensis TaxID=586413 RepID=UPI0005A9ED53|nr:DUF624 domain-containing protein [Oceanobacillus manasiensis]
MNVNGVVTTLEKMMNWVARLAYLNLLWLLFSLRGLFLAGVFPATVAALGVSRKWLSGEQDIKIWKTFKEGYSTEFKAANALGWILTAVGSLLYVNYRVLLGLQETVSFLVPFAFYFIIIVYVLVIIWSFPLLAHYQTNIFQHLKNAFIIGFSKVHISLGIGILGFVSIYFSLEHPAFIPFFLFSAIAIMWMWAAMYVFKALDKKTAEVGNEA